MQPQQGILKQEWNKWTCDVSISTHTQILKWGNSNTFKYWCYICTFRKRKTSHMDINICVEKYLSSVWQTHTKFMRITEMRQ